ncbi:hypothetical protein UPYG_G00319920 [Umbra pygmaea]|uniref:Uncharacterized protein n=1 Tax=Umbra pygmaea TaxID=75934 RepID=A0ABD0W087_UMBPY
MKRRQLLLALPLLPTITETFEDSLTAHPVHLAQDQPPTQCSQSLEEYIVSIQALARPVAPTSSGPVRIHRAGRPRHISKPQIKHSVVASLPQETARAIWKITTSPITTKGESPEQLSTILGMDMECVGRDPMEWLYGQTQTETRTHIPRRTQTRTDTCLRENISAALWAL